MLPCGRDPCCFWCARRLSTDITWPAAFVNTFATNGVWPVEIIGLFDIVSEIENRFYVLFAYKEKIKIKLCK